MLVAKKIVGWKKMLVEEFPLPFHGLSGHSLECKTEKRQMHKKPLGPRGKKFCWLGFFVGWDSRER